MEELFIDIIGHEGLYQISNLGRVKSLSRGVKNSRYGVKNLRERFLKPAKNRGGYLHLIITNYDGVQSKERVHRLVVNHSDGDKLNNDYNNLEWCTSSINNIHAYKNGLKKAVKGVDSHFYGRPAIRAVTLQCLCTGRKLNMAQAASEVGVSISQMTAMASGRCHNWTHLNKL